MTALASIVATPSGAAADVRAADWDTALTDYLSKREAAEATPVDDDQTDELVDLYCAAQDHLIENVPAPDYAALVTKLEMAFRRCEGFGFFDDYQAAILADLKRLDPLRQTAEAWIDRWCALGGDFGIIYDSKSQPLGVGRGIPMSYIWTPPAEHNPALRPHEWIIDPADHTGAVKMLESLLTLIPNLQDTVLSVALDRGLVRWPDGHQA
jgi:hypothetical protein